MTSNPKPAKTYSHAFTIAFSLESTCPDGSTLVGAAFREALLLRLVALTDEEMVEAVGMPFDTYEVEAGMGVLEEHRGSAVFRTTP